MNDRRKKAEEVKSKVVSLFHAAEKASPNGEVSYLDFCRIVDFVKAEFELDPPAEIDAALTTATRTVRPSEDADRQRKLAGGASAFVGAVLFLSGLVSVLNGRTLPNAPKSVMSTVWNGIKSIFVAPDQQPPNYNYVGFGLLLVGLFVLVVGVYVLARRPSTKLRTLSGLEIISDALDAWGATEPKAIGDVVTRETRVAK